VLVSDAEKRSRKRASTTNTPRTGCTAARLAADVHLSARTSALLHRARARALAAAGRGAGRTPGDYLHPARAARVITGVGPTGQRFDLVRGLFGEEGWSPTHPQRHRRMRATACRAPRPRAFDAIFKSRWCRASIWRRRSASSSAGSASRRDVRFRGVQARPHRARQLPVWCAQAVAS